MPHPFYEILNCSHYRKVFVVGDIHGEYTKLTYALLKVGFRVSKDLLISVGDLVDRGPQSEEFETFIAQPWVRRVVGNHDLQPREYLLGYEPAYNVERNGGEWFLAKSREEQERIAWLLEDAPLALLITTPAGKRVGITHADMGNRWSWIEQNSQDPKQERNLINILTGSREVITTVQNWPDIEPSEVSVQGVDHVFHGHTIIDEPLTVGNRTWIDTGACCGGPLTVIDIDEWLNNL